MPQLGPLFWVISFLVVILLLLSLMKIFYLNGLWINKVNSVSLKMMGWCW
uniref:ATP synthase F0 subunit 8 n=1 Tax=Austrarchaea monteithi TaxID=1028702 RepID=H2E471_9ARAC|nr:ATP synthase F0 subunit 8 [Austrarchaea monteithi]AEX88986.1 ATP synthase F0 subunit 8 [Austrarchaea monteithi]